MTDGNGSGNGPVAGSDRQGSDYPKGPLLRPMRRWRVAVFLGANLAAYAFVCVFVHFVSSGRWFSVTPAEYQLWAGRSLGEMCIQPLSIFTHPWMVLVTGLLLAAIVMIPLLIACLYHSRVSALFLICVAVGAHAPFLTLVLAAGCVLVAATDLRRRNPSLALLLGMIPVAVYLYVSARPPGIVLLPMQRLALGLPFVVAGFGALIAAAAVLIIAHYARYRPGVIWPVLVVFTALPVWTFHREIGSDELAFSILAAQLTPSEAVLADQVLPSAVSAADGPLTRAEISRARSDLEERKAEWIARCDTFLLRFPNSDRAATVLWMKGIAQDTQVSVLAMYDGYLRYYDEFPLEASADTWRRLAEQFGEDPRAAVGRLRLAQLAGRAGRIDEVGAHLDAGARILSDVFAAVPASRREALWSGLFDVPRHWPSRPYLQRTALQTAKLRWLIEANRVRTDPGSAAGFREFISLDRHRYSREEFVREVLDLSERLVHTDFVDNLHLLEALNDPDIYSRARQLLELEDESELDASIEANYELGRLALQATHDEGLSRLLDRPERYFRRVTDAQVNPWQREAAGYLGKLREREGSPL